MQSLVCSKSSINEIVGSGLFFRAPEILGLLQLAELPSHSLSHMSAVSCLESASVGQKSYSVVG